jgi:hypothetical protein
MSNYTNRSIYIRYTDTQNARNTRSDSSMQQQSNTYHTPNGICKTNACYATHQNPKSYFYPLHAMMLIPNSYAHKKRL